MLVLICLFVEFVLYILESNSFNQLTEALNDQYQKYR